MTLKVTKDKVPEFLKAIKALMKDQVLVGIAAEKAFRTDPDSDLNNAQIGYINEFGAPEMNIPARPHLVSGVKKAMPDIVKAYKKGAQQVLDGQYDKAKAAHQVVGIKASNSVKAVITAVIPPPLAPRTIAERKKRGRTGTTPLIDTGQYRRNIDYVVKPHD